MPQDSMLAGAGKENDPGTAGMVAVVVPKQEPRKRINLLESLERELNSTEYGAPATSGLQPIHPVVNPSKEMAKDEKSSSPAASNDKASLIDIQPSERKELDEDKIETTLPMSCQKASVQLVYNCPCSI